MHHLTNAFASWKAQLPYSLGTSLLTLLFQWIHQPLQKEEKEHLIKAIKLFIYFLMVTVLNFPFVEESLTEPKFIAALNIDVLCEDIWNLNLDRVELSLK